MSFPLPLRNPPRFGQHHHVRAEVAYVFIATIAIYIGFLPLPRCACEKFSIDCFRPTSPITSPWKLLVQAEEEQLQSTVPSHPQHLLGRCSAPRAPYLPCRCSSLWELRPLCSRSPAAFPGREPHSWGPAGRSHSSCRSCLPLGKGGVKGRKYRGRGKKKKSEQVSFFLCLAWGSCSFPWLLFFFQLLQF